MGQLSRRLLTFGAGAVLGGSFLPGRASAQVTDTRPPTIDTANVKDIADGVFVIGDHRTWLVPNIGIALGSDAALVVDTGLGPANGEAVLDVARRLAGPQRRLLVTLTHFHPEHGYGVQAFHRDATIIYNRGQRDELVEKGARYLALFRQTQGPSAVAALQGTEITMPHMVYDGPMLEIDLGGRKVELQTYGLAHTRGDQTVHLPGERILFAGDLIEERMFPIFPYFPPADTEVDGVHWASVLRGFQALDPKVVVPGHGDLGGIRIAQELASHIELIHGRVRTMRAAGMSADRIRTECKPQLLAEYPTWEHPQLVDLELNYNAALES